jgi:hypothetical protein
MAGAEGIEKIEDLGEIDRLERRRQELKTQLDELNREGPGFRHEMKNELEKLSADLSGAGEAFIMWTDSGYRPDKRRQHSSFHCLGARAMIPLVKDIERNRVEAPVGWAWLSRQAREAVLEAVREGIAKRTASTG